LEWSSSFSSVEASILARPPTSVSSRSYNNTFATGHMNITVIKMPYLFGLANSALHLQLIVKSVLLETRVFQSNPDSSICKELTFYQRKSAWYDDFLLPTRRQAPTTKVCRFSMKTYCSIRFTVLKAQDIFP